MPGIRDVVEAVQGCDRWCGRRGREGVVCEEGVALMWVG